MSGESIFSWNTASPAAQICSSPAQIQKLVRLKHSNRAVCAVCIQHGCVLSAIFSIAAHQTTCFVNRDLPNSKNASKSVPATKIFVFFDKEMKLPQGFSGLLRRISRTRGDYFWPKHQTHQASSIKHHRDINTKFVLFCFIKSILVRGFPRERAKRA
jgi:hypothetical protein